MVKKVSKGIVLAGGSGTRLYPATLGVSKQALPVFDKPMIYYPVSVLMLAGITEILIISTPRDVPVFKEILGDGERLGIKIDYKVQEKPNGLGEAFLIGEDFIGEDHVALILGDNIYYGQGLSGMLEEALPAKGACTFTYQVDDPSRFGIVTMDSSGNPEKIEEKPSKPDSDLAITGLYFFDSTVVSKAKKISPSERGELEIVDILKQYLEEGTLMIKKFGRGMAWLDTGTHESLFDAASFIAAIQKRQGVQVACLEEIAFLKGLIGIEELAKAAKNLKNHYGDYLMKIYYRNL